MENRNTEKEKTNTQAHQPRRTLGHLQLASTLPLKLTLSQAHEDAVRATNQGE